MSKRIQKNIADFADKRGEESTSGCSNPEQTQSKRNHNHTVLFDLNIAMGEKHKHWIRTYFVCSMMLPIYLLDKIEQIIAPIEVYQIGVVVIAMQKVSMFVLFVSMKMKIQLFWEYILFSCFS